MVNERVRQLNEQKDLCRTTMQIRREKQEETSKLESVGNDRESEWLYSSMLTKYKIDDPQH